VVAAVPGTMAFMDCLREASPTATWATSLVLARQKGLSVAWQCANAGTDLLAAFHYATDAFGRVPSIEVYVTDVDAQPDAVRAIREMK
jgi:hypothetical protein